MPPFSPGPPSFHFFGSVLLEVTITAHRCRLHYIGPSIFHLSLRADRPDKFHALALTHGGRDNGTPEDCGNGYYAAYALDPDGNNVEAGSGQGLNVPVWRSRRRTERAAPSQTSGCVWGDMPVLGLAAIAARTFSKGTSGMSDDQSRIRAHCKCCSVTKRTARRSRRVSPFARRKRRTIPRKRIMTGRASTRVSHSGGNRSPTELD